MTTTTKGSALLTAVNAVMQDVGYVQKDKRNEFHKYRYAGEESLLVVLRPALVKHGLVLIPSLEGEPHIDDNGNTHLVVSYTLTHVSGEVWPEKIRVPGSGNDRAKNGNVGDKGTYKALTGANKYLLFKLFQMATGDDPEVESAHDNDEVTPTKTERKAPSPKPTGTKNAADELINEITACLSVVELTAWGTAANAKTSIARLADEEQNRVRQAYGDNLIALKKVA
jgi:hypothetical protein